MVGTLSTSVSSSPSPNLDYRGRRGSRRPLIIICTILTVFLVAAVMMIKGRVSGTEFSPSHFQTRDFFFYEIPYLHVQLTPIRRSNSTGSFTLQIRAKSWINVPRGVPPSNWHLVTLWRGPTEIPAVASLLVRELELPESGGLFWENWNTDHPNRASVLWPLVQRLADRELYVLVPELMLLARTLPGDDDADKLAAVANQWVVDQYVGLVNDLRDADRGVLADDLLDEAISDFPLSKVLTALKPAFK